MPIMPLSGGVTTTAKHGIDIDNDDQRTDWIWLDAIPAKIIHPPERMQADERKLCSDHCAVWAG